jgi:lysophospholipid acyltransferase (LPLAT)-like uncharacterized protein
VQNDLPIAVHEVGGWRRVVLWPLATLLRWWARSLRLEADEATLRLLTYAERPAAIVIWHNRLILSPEIFRRYRTARPVHGLVSASKDGAWLAAFYRLIGLVPVRGSSSKLGREAARELIECLRDGNDVGITPDGPRGPCYEVKPGTVVVTRRTRAPMVLVGAEFSCAWRLRSWDRFYLPAPFSSVHMRCVIVESHGPDGKGVAVEAVQSALRSINPD